MKFEQNNKTIALNILFIPHNTETIRDAHRSEYNHKRKKQVTLLMIDDGKKHPSLSVTNLSALLQGKSSNHKEDFYCLNCFNSYTTKNKLKKHDDICNNHNSCRTEMLKWIKKILKRNPEKSYTEKKAKLEPSGWAMFTRCSLNEKEKKLNYYRRKDTIEKFCKKLKGHAMKIINFEKKEMILLTKEENTSYKEEETCHICKENFCLDKDDEDYINRKKVKDHCHYTGKFRGAAHSKCNLNYKVQKTFQ